MQMLTMSVRWLIMHDGFKWDG